MSDIKIFAKTIEETARQQIELFSELEAFKDSKIRIMPDVHAGAGCVIGFTADLGDKVIPNIVGVDIGCGMLTIELGKVDIDLEKLDNVIKKYVPNGMNVHAGRIAKFPELQELYCYRELRDTKRLERSIGTLGGGNHFIEVDVDADGNKYLIIHSGSRNLGKQVAEYYQSLAVELMQGKDELYKKQREIIDEYKATGRRSEIESAIKELHRSFAPKILCIQKDLCYLEGEYRERYLHDMKICQRYAVANRYYIGKLILENIGLNSTSHSFETIHNYIDDNNMVRKGAIAAHKGKMLLIPMNMRDGCILGVGKGNEDWNCSAPHGAGRLMSRAKAKETLSMAEYQNTMDGIYTTSICQETLDEAPQAYKPLEEITELIKPTVDIVSILKPIYNFKAKE